MAQLKKYLQFLARAPSLTLSGWSPGKFGFRYSSDSTKSLFDEELKVSHGGPRNTSYDVVIVGGGHNGLVAAAYLAKSGIRTCVLERRGLVGGAAVTEEIVPGYRFSRASYLLSLLRPQILKELDLKRHGLVYYFREPSAYCPLRTEFWAKDGSARSLTLGSGQEADRLQISQFSTRDADRLPAYYQQQGAFVKAIDHLLDQFPPSLDGSASFRQLLFQELPPLLKAGRALGLGNVRAFYDMMTAPAAKVLDSWFESDPLKAILATDACVGAMVSPYTAGSGYVLLHHVMGGIDGKAGSWVYPQGGMGSVSKAIAKAALEAGAEIVVDAEVEEVLVDPPGGGRSPTARGVRLKDGGKVVEAKYTLSNATPEVTFKRLLDPSLLDDQTAKAVDGVDYTSPVTKINVALDKIPNFLADPNDDTICKEDPRGVMPHHRGSIHLSCENMGVVNQAFLDAQGPPGRRHFSKRPMVEMVIPSSLDPTLAPPVHHVCLLFTQYTPYDLAGGGWTKEATQEYTDIVFDTVEQYAPGFKASIVGYETLTPPVLEATFGLTGGNIFHGAMTLDQLFFNRPARGLARPSPPSTPVENLLICGSGTHPGGGVMGAPGRLAALRVCRLLGTSWRFSK